MRLYKLIFGLCCLGAMISCKDDDDNNSLSDLDKLTGKYWYINNYLGNKTAYEVNDGINVVRFEGSGILTGMEYGGRRDSLLGEWRKEDDQLILTFLDGTEELWYLTSLGKDEIKARVNGGDRVYRTEFAYLEDMKADAFLVNEYFKSGAGYRLKTYIGANVTGNRNIMEALMLLAADYNTKMLDRGYYWSERKPLDEDFIDFKGQKQQVRFYFKVGRKDQVKLDDYIYTGNLEPLEIGDYDLRVVNTPDAGKMTVKWNPVAQENVYYKVEVFNENMSLVTPYFVSNVQLPESSSLTIDFTTAGEINKINELKKGKKYVVRLTMLLYEPGIDFINNRFANNNIQAVTYVTKVTTWE